MTKISFELPASILLRNVEGKPVYLVTADIPADTWRDIAVGGAKTILTNAFNSGGKDVPEANRLANMNKRLDSWKRGEFVMAERGESAYTGMWNAYVDDMRAKYREAGGDVSEAKLAKDRAELVKASFGDKAKNTVALFFKALAATIAKASNGDEGEVLEALEAKYLALAEEAAQKTAKAAAKVDVSMIDLTGFMKPKK
jgi:hypothetical protein